MDKIGFFEVSAGNRSQSRLITFIMVVAALIFAQEVIYFSRNNIVVAVASAASIFLSIAAPALTFLFSQKKQEMKSENNIENDTK
jgi:Mn2+/Fe2+ NRAMP family transporter